MIHPLSLYQKAHMSLVLFLVWTLSKQAQGKNEICANVELFNVVMLAGGFVYVLKN